MFTGGSRMFFGVCGEWITAVNDATRAAKMISGM
jgi:hypothetical protein